MKAMFRPMAVVRAGPSYTMAEGKGLMVMVGVSIPLRREALRAGVAEAEAMRDMASAELDAMTRMIAGEVAAARAAVDALGARVVAIRDDVLPRARAAIAPAVSGYAAGQLPLTSVLAAVQALWQSESDRVSAELQFGLAVVKLQRAAGTFEGAGR
jgi:outer membrane protein TolC